MRMLLAVLATGYALCRHREVRQHGVSVAVSAILDGCSFHVTVRSVSDRILQLAFQVVTYVRNDAPSTVQLPRADAGRLYVQP